MIIIYIGSNISIESIGYIARLGQLDALVKRLAMVTDEEVRDKLHKVKLARYYYTYEGVMTQIEMFFRAPFSPQNYDSHLVCYKGQTGSTKTLASILDTQIAR